MYQGICFIVSTVAVLNLQPQMNESKMHTSYNLSSAQGKHFNKRIRKGESSTSAVSPNTECLDLRKRQRIRLSEKWGSVAVYVILLYDIWVELSHIA